MTSSESASKLNALVNRLRSEVAKASTAPADLLENGQEVAAASQTALACFEADPTLRVFVHSFFVEDAAPDRADLAMAALARTLVDCNELRVCTPDEIAAVVGRAVTGAVARSARLKDALTEVFRRDHAVCLKGLVLAPKKEALAVLAAVAPPFVAARTALLALGIHTMPADAKTTAALVDAGVLSEESTPADAAAFLTKAIKPADGPQVHCLLQQWAGGATKSAPARPQARRAKTVRGPRSKAGPTRSGRTARGS